MARDGEGRILNVSSIGGRIGVPHLAAYAAGKFALTGLSETLHAELRSHGVRVTTATPGLMRTGSYVNVSLRGDHAREFQWFTAMSATPLTSMRTDRAAAQMLAALRSGKAMVTPGAPARAATLAAALAPNPTAAVTSVATSVLPDAEDGRGLEPCTPWLRGRSRDCEDGADRDDAASLSTGRADVGVRDRDIKSA